MDDELEFNTHHGSPILFGDYEDLVPLPPPAKLPEIDMQRALRPKNPGMSPVLHLSLRYFDELQYAVPKAEDKSIHITGVNPAVPASAPAQAQQVPAQPQQEPLFKTPEPRPREFYIGGMLKDLDPLYATILYFAFGLGILLLPITAGVRYALLWSVMALVGLFFTFVDGPAPPEIRSSDLLWGVGAAFTLSLPLFILLTPILADISYEMFPGVQAGSIISYAVFAAPIAETLFFRAMLQDTRGLGPAVIGAGLNAAMLYAPGLIGANSISTAVLVVVIFSALGALYSFIRERYGLPASLACQITAHTMLLVLPVAIIPIA